MSSVAETTRVPVAETTHIPVAETTIMSSVAETTQLFVILARDHMSLWLRPHIPVAETTRPDSYCHLSQRWGQMYYSLAFFSAIGIDHSCTVPDVLKVRRGPNTRDHPLTLTQLMSQPKKSTEDRRNRRLHSKPNILNIVKAVKGMAGSIDYPRPYQEGPRERVRHPSKVFHGNHAELLEKTLFSILAPLNRASRQDCLSPLYLQRSITLPRIHLPWPRSHVEGDTPLDCHPRPRRRDSLLRITPAAQTIKKCVAYPGSTSPLTGPRITEDVPTVPPSDSTLGGRGHARRREGLQNIVTQSIEGATKLYTDTLPTQEQCHLFRSEKSNTKWSPSFNPWWKTRSTRCKTRISLWLQTLTTILRKLFRPYIRHLERRSAEAPDDKNNWKTKKVTRIDTEEGGTYLSLAETKDLDLYLDVMNSDHKSIITDTIPEVRAIRLDLARNGRGQSFALIWLLGVGSVGNSDHTKPHVREDSTSPERSTRQEEQDPSLSTCDKRKSVVQNALKHLLVNLMRITDCLDFGKRQVSGKTLGRRAPCSILTAKSFVVLPFLMPNLLKPSITNKTYSCRPKGEPLWPEPPRRTHSSASKRSVVPQLTSFKNQTLLQYHVDTGQPQATQRSGRPLKSIRQRLKGKEGRMRGNLNTPRPSLHKMSMMGHRIKVMPYSTFPLNLSVTTPYNADSYGDEMNMHVQDALSGCRLCTRRDNFMEKDLGELLCGMIDKKSVGNQEVTRHRITDARLMMEHGHEMTRNFFDNIQKMINQWLVSHGYTIGTAKKDVNDAIIKAQYNEFEAQPGATHQESFERSQPRAEQDERWCWFVRYADKRKRIPFGFKGKEVYGRKRGSH
ncbi:RNA polymerase II [Planoprotostelium fungivorum]|uniref:DNA-directed RNA polymerase subunit n=1 Tax=Planoprotostelium fungivorum TaxID=1890364 RepID=A0A2P6MV42_9EUKA|nr:RNA polymerase II [Planoprotostelium fungivorum]